jgi:hypothetical protein
MSPANLIYHGINLNLHPQSTALQARYRHHMFHHIQSLILDGVGHIPVFKLQRGDSLGTCKIQRPPRHHSFGLSSFFPKFPKLPAEMREMVFMHALLPHPKARKP